MFTLNKTIHINYDAVIDAMLDRDAKNLYWFNSTTGECLSETDLMKKVGEDVLSARKDKKYFLVPKIKDSVRIEWIKDFIQEMVQTENKKLAQALKQDLQKENPYDNFITTLEATDDILLGCFEGWEGDSAFEKMKEWFGKLPLKISEEPDFFDDCPMCQAMKEGKI